MTILTTTVLLIGILEATAATVTKHAYSYHVYDSNGLNAFYLP